MKHQPATPLPWSYVPISDFDEDDDGNKGHWKDGQFFPVTDDELTQQLTDHDFAAHAANAYPRLIEQVKVFAFADWACDCVDQGWHGEEGHTLSCPQGDAQTLLRDLGELS